MLFADKLRALVPPPTPSIEEFVRSGGGFLNIESYAKRRVARLAEVKQILDGLPRLMEAAAKAGRRSYDVLTLDDLDYEIFFKSRMCTLFIKPDIERALEYLRDGGRLAADWMANNGFKVDIRTVQRKESVENGFTFWTDYILVARWPKPKVATRKAA